MHYYDIHQGYTCVAHLLYTMVAPVYRYHLYNIYISIIDLYTTG